MFRFGVLKFGPTLHYFFTTTTTSSPTIELVINIVLCACGFSGGAPAMQQKEQQLVSFPSPSPAEMEQMLGQDVTYCSAALCWSDFWTGYCEGICARMCCGILAI